MVTDLFVGLTLNGFTLDNPLPMTMKPIWIESCQLWSHPTTSIWHTCTHVCTHCKHIQDHTCTHACTHCKHIQDQHTHMCMITCSAHTRPTCSFIQNYQMHTQSWPANMQGRHTCTRPTLACRQDRHSHTYKTSTHIHTRPTLAYIQDWHLHTYKTVTST